VGPVVERLPSKLEFKPQYRKKKKGLITITIILNFVILGLELRAYTLSHTSPFCDGYFRDRVSQTVCLV
jgi:hypothetical protein